MFLISFNVSAAKVTKVSGTIKCTGNQQHTVIKGKTSNGKTVWTFKSSKAFAAGPASVNMRYDSKYVYIMDCSTYIRLAKNTGKVLVKKKISCMNGHGTTMCLDSSGNLYAVNKYNEYCVKINRSGKVLWKYKVKTGYSYIDSIKKKGDYVYLYYAADYKVDKLSAKTGKRK